MVIRDLFSEFDEIVIVIGSAQEAFTCRNPFTAGERIEMIDRVLRENGYSRDSYWLIPVPDLHKPLAWTTFVLGMVPRVNAVASGNPHTLGIYEWIGFKTIRVNMYDPHIYSGTHIRKLMVRGSDWEELVPRPVADYIKSINGVERVREACRSEHY